MTDRAADITTLLAEWEAASEYAKSWGVFDGDRMTDAGDALAAALTAQTREIALLEETATTLGKQWKASAERERQLRDALARIAVMSRRTYGGVGVAKPLPLDLHYDVARSIAVAALAASPEGQTG